MKLHCLGTTGFHPSPSRHTACYYLPDLSIVLDAGTGIFRLVEHLLEKPRKSLSILLSHSHLDHVVGLTFLVDALAVTQLEHIKLFGEPDKLDAVRKHLYHELLFPVQPSMEFVPLIGSSGETRIGNTDVAWFPLEHPGGSVGYKLTTDGKQLVYVTDTVGRAESEYVQHILQPDLLLHECYFGNEHRELAEKTGHSWLSAVTDIVRKAQARRTVLIHINPLAEILDNAFTLDDEHRQLNMSIAEDGMQLEF